MLLRRDGRRGHRFLGWQVALFFLGAGIWGVGLLLGMRRLTWVSMAVLVLAMLLGVVGRRERPAEPES